MAESRRGLGRGLSALIEEANSAATPEARSALGVRELMLDIVHRNPEQPRRAFGEEDLRELTDSVRARGVISPIVVRPAPGKPGEFQIVAGERRWRASQAAGLRAIPAVIRDLDDLEVMEIALIENIQRADLNPLEEARGYAAIESRFGRGAEAIAKTVGKSRSHVANTMRLTRLPDEVKSHLESGALSAGHARALLDVPHAVDLAHRIVAEGLNVRQTEALAKRSKPPRASKRSVAAEKDVECARSGDHALQRPRSAGRGARSWWQGRASPELCDPRTAGRAVLETDAIARATSPRQRAENFLGA